MTEFEGVVPALGQALIKRGYTTLTPVQDAVLAPELKEVDALVSAQTGSGKTVAFGLNLAPTLLDGADRFIRASEPLGLVVAPTRELAMQVKGELQWLYAMTGASVASCVGGMDMRNERFALERGAHIVVGTPGRLRDHIERGSLDMSGLKAVVLDEADEMLDLGFREDLEFILQAAPPERRTLMFSATVPRTIVSLAKRYQRDAVRVTTTAEREQHHDIDYRALTVAPNDRENAIINVLRHAEAKTALVFCGTRATVNHMTSRFANRGFSVVALSGELSQNERTHALQAIRDGRARVCIATDVAARGIDLPNLELVIHADPPKNKESLLHRSGRTGRAGRKGVSTLIVPYTSRRHVERLLSNANIEATWARPPSAEEILRRDRERILEDPGLSEPISEDEKAFADQLLARHDAETIAVALLRQHMAGQSAPEELLDATDRGGPQGERRQKRHEDFKDGVWFSLSIGRDQQAEPRWLLPMLCRVAHLTKRDIGAIRVHKSETHVEVSPDSLARFVEATTPGPARKIDKSIKVTRLDGIPKPPEDDGQYTPRPQRQSRVNRRAAKEAAAHEGIAPANANASTAETTPVVVPPSIATEPAPSAPLQASTPENTSRADPRPTKQPKPKKPRHKRRTEPAAAHTTGWTPSEHKPRKKKKKVISKDKGKPKAKKSFNPKHGKSDTRNPRASGPASGDPKKAS